MKTKTIVSLSLILGIALNSFAQTIQEGTYMSMYTLTHYSLTKSDENNLLIQPCQRFDSQLTTNNETFAFSKLDGTEKFGWNGGSQIILDSESEPNTLSFPNPMNMNTPVKLMLLHPANTAPAAGIKTYYDETEGGYSNARILITDPNEAKIGNCLIHSNPTDELNPYIVGSFNGMYDANSKATFNADHTGTFLGLPMNWSIVSDHNGKIKKQDYPDGGFIVHLMIEFENELPIFVDKPSAGKKLAIIEGLRLNSEDGSVEIRQMKK